MFIFIALGFGFVFSVTVMGAYELIAEKINRVRFLKEYANRPKKVLMMDILNFDAYSERFHDLRQVLGYDRAATIMIRRMLMDVKAIKYRKEKL